MYMNCQKENADRVSIQESVRGTDMCKHKQYTRVHLYVRSEVRRVKEVTLLKIFTRQSSREKFKMISLVDRLVSSRKIISNKRVSYFS